MKKSGLMAAGAMLLSAVPFAQPASAQMRPLADPVVAHSDPETLFTSSDPKLHRNKQAALHIVKELLQCNQWDRASEWLTDRYIQHNPLAASGLDPVVHYFVNIAKRKPTPSCDTLASPVVAVQAEGDFVTVLFVREFPTPGYPGETYTSTWFDSWRFVDGKADEHWDPATLPPVALDNDTILQQSKDRALIGELMWNYVRAADNLRADDYAALFTEDGSFNDVKGRDALRAMISGIVTAQAGRREKGTLQGDMQHFMTNQHIEFIDKDHARVHYYWQTVFATEKLDPPPRLAAAGNGVDEVVRVNGKWMIKSRDTLAHDD